MLNRRESILVFANIYSYAPISITGFRTVEKNDRFRNKSLAGIKGVTTPPPRGQAPR